MEGGVAIIAGGPVTIGRSRGGDLSVRTLGPVTVGEAAARTVVESGGGDIRIKRLAGRDVRIVSGGGAVRCGVRSLPALLPQYACLQLLRLSETLPFVPGAPGGGLLREAPS